MAPSLHSTVIALALLAAACTTPLASGSPAATPAEPASPSALPEPRSTPTVTPTSTPTVTERPALTPEPSGVSVLLFTFTWSRERDGVEIGCDALGVANPVYGHLAGSLDEPEVVWLDAPDGSRLWIAWPEGFEAHFGPTLVIHDETGATFAREGDAVMAQVSRDDAAGTVEDPYLASGILLAGSFTPDDLSTGIDSRGCYPQIPDVGPAAWWVDPASLPIPTTSRVIDAFIMERACASGRSPEGRVLEPTIEYRPDGIVITFLVTKRLSPQDCPGNPAHPVRIHLEEPVGLRALLDGSTSPPRDATREPEA